VRWGSLRTATIARFLPERARGHIPVAVRQHFHATRNPGAGEDFTDFAAVVQLHVRVAIGLQPLTVKSRFLTGENTVRIRGDPPAFACDFKSEGKLPSRSEAKTGPPVVYTSFGTANIFNAPVAQSIRVRRFERRGCR